MCLLIGWVSRVSDVAHGPHVICKITSWFCSIELHSGPHGCVSTHIACSCVALEWSGHLRLHCFLAARLLLQSLVLLSNFSLPLLSCRFIVMNVWKRLLLWYMYIIWLYKPLPQYNSEVNVINFCLIHVYGSAVPVSVLVYTVLGCAINFDRFPLSFFCFFWSVV